MLMFDPETKKRKLKIIKKKEKQLNNPLVQKTEKLLIIPLRKAKSSSNRFIIKIIDSCRKSDLLTKK